MGLAPVDCLQSISQSLFVCLFVSMFTARVSVLWATPEQTQGLLVPGTQSTRERGSGRGPVLGETKEPGALEIPALSPILPLAWADSSLSQPLPPP